MAVTFKAKIVTRESESHRRTEKGSGEERRWEVGRVEGRGGKKETEIQIFFFFENDSEDDWKREEDCVTMFLAVAPNLLLVHRILLPHYVF